MLGKYCLNALSDIKLVSIKPGFIVHVLSVKPEFIVHVVSS